MPFELSYFGTLNSMKTECLGLLDADLQEKLKFPDDINEIHVCKSQNNCYILRTTVKNSEEIDDFLKKWTRESRVVWRINKTCPRRNSAGLKNIYWKEFRCQNSNVKIHKTTKRMHKKHTNCEAYMGITIKKIPPRCRSKDPHLPKYPTIIKINNNHNHKIEHHEYLKNCPVSQETKIKFLRMFEKGHTPLSALNLHRIDLRGEYGESIVFSEMDRSICPDNGWCYRLYAAFLAKKEKVPDDQNEEPEPEDENESIKSVISTFTDFDDSYKSVKNITFDANSNHSIENIECCIENTVYDNDIPIKIETRDEDENIIEQIDDFSPSNDPLDITDDEVKKYLSPFIELMTSKLKAAPELFVTAIETFNGRLKHFETDLDLADALHGFGK